jgi:hypothetical protein
MVRPPRVVALALAGREIEQVLDGVERRRSIAGAPRKLAERQIRRLRSRVQDRGVLIRRARGVTVSERLFLGSEEERRVVEQQGVRRRDRPPQFGRGGLVTVLKSITRPDGSGFGQPRIDVECRPEQQFRLE